MEIYGKHTTTGLGEKTQHQALLTLGTRMPGLPAHVQVLAMRRGTWHRPEPHAGDRHVAVFFQHEPAEEAD